MGGKPIGLCREGMTHPQALGCLGSLGSAASTGPGLEGAPQELNQAPTTWDHWSASVLQVSADFLRVLFVQLNYGVRM